MKAKIKAYGKEGVHFRLAGTMALEKIIKMNPDFDRIEIEANGERSLIARDYPNVPYEDIGKQTKAVKKRDDWIADMLKNGWRFAGSWGGYALMKRVDEDSDAVVTEERE